MLTVLSVRVRTAFVDLLWKSIVLSPPRVWTLASSALSAHSGESVYTSKNAWHLVIEVVHDLLKAIVLNADEILDRHLQVLPA